MEWLRTKVLLNQTQYFIKYIFFQNFSLFYEPEDFYLNVEELMKNENGGVAVCKGWSITHLDVVERKAYLETGEPITYGKCLIATGMNRNL